MEPNAQDQAILVRWRSRRGEIMLIILIFALALLLIDLAFILHRTHRKQHP